MAFSGLPCCVLSFTLLLLPLSIAGASAEFQKAPVSGRRQLEEDGFGAWRRFVAELPSAGDATVHNDTFVLAAERTYRQDPMNGYQRYTGGWNIKNQHYWAVSSSPPPPSLLLLRLLLLLLLPRNPSSSPRISPQSVAFTAIPLFAIAVAWFLGCGLGLLLICCCYCCCGRRKHSYSRAADVISMVLLALLICAAMYQTTTPPPSRSTSFHDSIASLVLQRRICHPVRRTGEVSQEHVGDTGLRVFSIFGLQFLVSILVLVAWILVAGTFILCGIFLLIHK
ncbi:hypothetical protein BHE74_00051068 [Ensete ventricosum]|nr:hypothetical protein BHE74_00051068 [Ensete ventricosum]